MTTSHEVDQNRPLRLAEAAARYFGSDSGISGKSLRRLARKGKLRTIRIAGKDFTTLADLAAMVAGSGERATMIAKPKPASTAGAVERAAQAIAGIGGAR